MGLKKQLDEPYELSAIIVSQTLTSFAFNVEDALIYIGYSLNVDDPPGVFQTDVPLTLSGSDYTDFITRMNELGATMSGSEAQQQTALEYTPGAGTITGDTKTLTTPYAIDGTVVGQDIDSYAYSVADELVHIGYSNMDSLTSNLQSNIVYTLSGQEYYNFLVRFDELETSMTVAQAQIQTCLEAIPGDGVIVDV